MPTKKTRSSRKPTSNNITTAPDAVANAVPDADAVVLSTEVFRKSDRLQAFLTGSSKSIGASCNVFSVNDSLSSISEAAAWSIHVSGYQGAPSLDLSNIRPRNSEISSGGNSSGAASFGQIYDGVIGSMRRPTKKNGAGIIWLNWNHPDLEEFLSNSYSYAFRGIYIPNDKNTEELTEFLSSPQFDLIVDAFEHNKAFVCKRPGNDKFRDEPLFLNLCTEVMIPHRGFCILGVINLSMFNQSNIHQLESFFVDSVLSMKDDMLKVLSSAQNTELACNSPANRQFGLGVSGLASMLANFGVNYKEFEAALSDAFLPKSDEHIIQVAGRARNNVGKGLAHSLVYEICKSYLYATDVLGNEVSRAFCVQPSATGAYQCADVSGYHSSPELQPVIGIRDKTGVHTIRKSEMLGNEKIMFHPNTETIDDVPYEIYASICSLWQRLLDSTKLGHRHSACFYGDKFTKEDMLRFVNSYQQNLYYRLQPYNAVALDKTDVSDGVETDVDIDSLLSNCSIQTKGTTECDCTM